MDARYGAILFVDVVGSTKRSALDARNIKALMDGDMARLTRLIKSCKGEIANHTGDGFMVLFYNNYQAFLFAWRMSTFLTGRAQDESLLDYRLGLHFGLYNDSVVDGGRRYDGLAPSLAARLQGISPINGLAFSEDVYSREDSNEFKHIAVDRGIITFKPGESIHAYIITPESFNDFQPRSASQVLRGLPADSSANTDAVRIATKNQNSLLLPEPCASTSQMLTDDSMPSIPSGNVFISIDLMDCAVNEAMFNDLKRNYSEDYQCTDEGWNSPPREVSLHLAKKNIARAKDGVTLETAEIPLVRLVKNPSIIDQEYLSLRVAPVTFDLYAASTPYPADGSKYKPDAELLEALEKYKSRFKRTMFEDELIDSSNLVPLGIEALVVTADNYALLRLKATSTTVGASEWDVTFSGYARLDPKWGLTRRKDGLSLNLNRFAQWEFKRETNVDASLEDSRILGVHQNLLSGAMDILAVYRVDVTHYHLAEKIKLESQIAQEKHDDPGHTAEYWKARKMRLVNDFSFSDKKELDSSPGVPEHQVHGTQNWFVQFDHEALLSFFAKIKDNGQTILPEAHQVILRALNAASIESQL